MDFNKGVQVESMYFITPNLISLAQCSVIY